MKKIISHMQSVSKPSIHNTTLEEKIPEKKVDSLWLKSMPWLIGGGMALAHINSSLQCTIPQQGRCSTCGSCVVALGALVGWALLKQSDDNLYRKPYRKP